MKVFRAELPWPGRAGASLRRLWESREQRFPARRGSGAFLTAGRRRLGEISIGREECPHPPPQQVPQQRGAAFHRPGALSCPGVLATRLEQGPDPPFPAPGKRPPAQGSTAGWQTRRSLTRVIASSCAGSSLSGFDCAAPSASHPSSPRPLPSGDHGEAVLHDPL